LIFVQPTLYPKGHRLGTQDRKWRNPWLNAWILNVFPCSLLG